MPKFRVVFSGEIKSACMLVLGGLPRESNVID